MRFARLLFPSVLATSALGCDLVLGLGDYTETSAPGAGGATSTSTGASPTSSSTGASVTGAGGGGSPACTPGTDYPCYEGPAMTENVGTCHGGMHTCKADGATFTDCVQQVVPTAETCRDDKQDEDCDHAECVLRSIRFGDDKDQSVGAIATDAMGNVYLAGQFKGTLAFDASHTLTNMTANPSLYVAKLDPTGAVVWASSYPTVVAVTGLTLDSAGNLILIGVFDGVLTGLAPTPPTCIDYGCSAIVKFDTSGKPSFALQVNIDQITNATGVTIGANNSIYLWGDMSCGDQCSSSTFWLRKLSSSGSTTWTKTYTAASGYSARQAGRIAFEPLTGHVWVVGNFMQTEALGGTAVTSAGGWDIVIGEIDANGNTISKRVLGDAADQFGNAVAVDSSANIYFAGSFAGKIVAGVNTLQSNGGLDTFVLRINANGQYGWAKAFGGAGDQTALALSVQPGPVPTAVFTGFTSANVDYGGGLLTAPGGLDAPVVKLNGSDGAYVWSRLFGDVSNQIGRDVVTLPDGRSVLAMNAAGTFDLGGGPIMTAGGADIVVATLGQ